MSYSDQEQSSVITRHAVLVKMLANPSLDESEQEAMAVAGLLGELGEVAELLKKQRFHSKAYTQADLIKELGDVTWYLHYLCLQKNISLTNVIECNILKLTERYPNGFVAGGGIRK